MHGGGTETTLEYSPTWVVSSVCGVIVAMSLLVERSLHSLGKYFKKKGNNTLYEALQKVKEELMLMGFISLMLTVSQTWINSVCIPSRMANILLPCSKSHLMDLTNHESEHQPPPFHVFSSRHLLSESDAEDSDETEYCATKGKVPMFYATALHHLHTFIFVLAFVHVVFCALTIIFGSTKIRRWKRWEDYATTIEIDEALKKNDTYVEKITSRLGSGSMIGWLQSFLKQFYGSVTKSDYLTLRLGFIKKHCPGNAKFDFHRYMMRRLEADFKKVVGISWYLWAFVLVFFLVDVDGWDTYLFEAFIPFFMLLAVGTKLEHVIRELSEDVAQQHVAVEGDLAVRPSDELFWFGSPKFVLVLIHFILFQNSFELAYLFFILLEYHRDSCIIGTKASVIVRIVLGVFVRFVCSYSTLPLYAIVTQMGSSFKKEIFDENTQKGLQGWVQHAKGKGKGFRKSVESRQIHPLTQMVQDADYVPPATGELSQLHRKTSMSMSMSMGTGPNPMLIEDANDVRLQSMSKSASKTETSEPRLEEKSGI